MANLLTAYLLLFKSRHNSILRACLVGGVAQPAEAVLICA